MTWTGLFSGVDTELVAALTEAMPVAITVVGLTSAAYFALKFIRRSLR